MSGEEARRHRQADNERLLREANWEIALMAGADLPAAADDEELLLSCACGREGCRERVLVTVAEYAAAHREPHRFVVVPGHETPRMERVVERHASYLVVEKLPTYQAPDGAPPPA